MQRKELGLLLCLLPSPRRRCARISQTNKICSALESPTTQCWSRQPGKWWHILECWRPNMPTDSACLLHQAEVQRILAIRKGDEKDAIALIASGETNTQGPYVWNMLINQLRACRLHGISRHSRKQQSHNQGLLARPLSEYRQRQ